MDRRQTDPNHCAALDCTVPVGGKLFCRRHWERLAQHRPQLMRAFLEESKAIARSDLHPTIPRIQLMVGLVQELAEIEGKTFHKLPEVDKVTGEIIRPTERS